MLSATQPFTLSPKLLRNGVLAGFAALYVILSLWAAMNIFLGSNFTNDNNRPPEVQRRPLMHTATQLIVDMTPDSALVGASGYLSELRQHGWLKDVVEIRYQQAGAYAQPFMMLLEHDYIYFIAVKMALVYLSIWMFIGMMYKLARVIFPESRIYALCAPLLGLLVTFAFSPEFAYSYDFLELFFCCALLYALYTERFVLYLVLMGIGTMNKETTMFTIFFFAAWFFGRMPQQRYVILLMLQVLVFMVARDMAALWVGLDTQLIYMWRPVRNITALYNYDFYHLGMILLVILLVTCRWQKKPLFLRYGLWLVVPNLLAYLLVCNRNEYRNLYWCMPPMFLLATHTLVRLADVAHLPVFAPKAPKQAE